jgi:hypothetical protein
MLPSDADTNKVWFGLLLIFLNRTVAAWHVLHLLMCTAHRLAIGIYLQCVDSTLEPASHISCVTTLTSTVDWKTSTCTARGWVN